MVSKSETSGVTFPWEKRAMNGDELPDGLEYPDQILYLSLRMLYAQLKQGVIDRPTGILEKRKLLDVYRIYQFNDQLGKEWVRTIKETEIAREEYLKNRTLENADRLLNAIIGIRG